MEFKFREGNIENKNQLKSLAVRSYGQFEKILTKENWNILYNKLVDDDTYKNLLNIAKCFVCEYENNIIGVAYLVPSGNPTEIFDASWSYIRMVGVDPKFRGHGISRKLTQNCVAFANKSGENIIALHTSEIMDAARYIYEDLGFKRVKEIKPIFGKKYWLYQLMLE